MPSVHITPASPLPATRTETSSPLTAKCCHHPVSPAPPPAISAQHADAATASSPTPQHRLGASATSLITGHHPPATAREPSGGQHPFLPLRLAPSVFYIHNSAGDGQDHPGFISPSADTTMLMALPLSHHCAFGWEKEPGLKTCEQSQDN